MKMIDFSRGHPNESLLPTNTMKEILAQVDTSCIAEGLQYGDTKGNSEFIGELQDFLERQCAEDNFASFHTPNADSRTDMFLTTGVSHGIELLCSTQTKPGDIVYVERPTYFLVSGIFQSHGLELQTLPVDSEHGGIDVPRFVQQLDSGELPIPRLMYIIPAHHNPTGRTLPIEDRILLAEAAEHHGFLLIADEVYHLLDWRQDGLNSIRPARMSLLNQKQDDSSCCGCVSVSSFTKIFAPGVRCGWIEAGPTIIKSIEDYGYLQSQGGCNPFMGEIMRIALKTRTADSVLKGLQQGYHQRAELLVEKLSVEPRIHIVNRPFGGYFLWIRFPIPSVDVLQLCRQNGVSFLPGISCDPKSAAGDNSLVNCARLCFADLDVADLEQGADILVACFRQRMVTLPS